MSDSREQLVEASANANIELKRQIDSLTAERDGLRRELETQEHLAGQASRDYLRVLDRADELQERVDSLTAERDQLQEQHGRQAKTIERLTAELESYRKVPDPRKCNITLTKEFVFIPYEVD